MPLTFFDRFRRGSALALLLCAMPLICLAENQPRTITSPSDLPPGEEISLPLSHADDPIADQLPASELAGRELIAAPEADPFGYNLRQSGTTWLVGDGDDLGFFSLETYPSLEPGEKLGMTGGMGFHFVGGPIRTDLPPRLFDLHLGLQQRKWLSETLGYDLLATVGAYSDFEGSARQGIRFPGHAVGYYRYSPQVDLVLGIEYLDRDDISLLPVAGLIFTPTDELRLELVFPRPRVELSINPTHSVYVAGELGGGTWAIERVSRTNDVVTYRDLRLLVGISHRGEDGKRSALEIGYVFGRDLSYRSRIGDYEPDDTLLLRLVQLY